MVATWASMAGPTSAFATTPVGGQDTVTMVEGASFCVCGSTGDITPGNSQGVFHADSRVLSQWQIEVDDEPFEPAQVLWAAPYHAMFLGRVRCRRSVRGQDRPDQTGT
jgi:hypothetical protein